MTRISAAQQRLQQASDLAAVLDGAYEAFDGMVSVIPFRTRPAACSPRS
jgi:hypothetical protein